MASGEIARNETGRGRASSESVVRLRRDPEGWLRSAWEEGTHPVLAAGLSTLSVGYRAALLVRGLSYDWRLLSTRRLPCPVVSLGNLTVGGSGKTPLVELAALTLVALGAAPAVVSRGYGRSTRGVLRGGRPSERAARGTGGRGRAPAPGRAAARDPRGGGREPLRGRAPRGGNLSAPPSSCSTMASRTAPSPSPSRSWW